MRGSLIQNWRTNVLRQREMQKSWGARFLPGNTDGVSVHVASTCRGNEGLRRGEIIVRFGMQLACTGAAYGRGCQIGSYKYPAQ
jgi:hypothetical protein